MRAKTKKQGTSSKICSLNGQESDCEREQALPPDGGESEGRDHKTGDGQGARSTEAQIRKCSIREMQLLNVNQADWEESEMDKFNP